MSNTEEWRLHSNGGGSVHSNADVSPKAYVDQISSIGSHARIEEDVKIENSHISPYAQVGGPVTLKNCDTVGGFIASFSSNKLPAGRLILTNCKLTSATPISTEDPDASVDGDTSSVFQGRRVMICITDIPPGGSFEIRNFNFNAIKEDQDFCHIGTREDFAKEVGAYYDVKQGICVCSFADIPNPNVTPDMAQLSSVLSAAIVETMENEKPNPTFRPRVGSPTDVTKPQVPAPKPAGKVSPFPKAHAVWKPDVYKSPDAKIGSPLPKPNPKDLN